MAKNNRSFFRIDVMMPCSYRIMTRDEAINSQLPLVPDASYIEKHFMDDISKWDEQLNEIISQIGQKSAILSQALSIMNDKLNFLMQTLDEKQLTKSIPQRMVNISAGGIAIKVDGQPEADGKIDLLIQPLAEEDPVLVRCNIVKIIPETNNQSTVALEYQSISEEDRRKLVYFIQSKEIELANQQKNN